MTDKRITLNIDIGEEFISSVLITAFDGAVGSCWYWADMVPGGSWTIDGDGTWRAVGIMVDGEERVVDADVIVKGIKEVLEYAEGANLTGVLFNAIVTDDPSDVDADVADYIVQTGLFDKVVYG